MADAKKELEIVISARNEASKVLDSFGKKVKDLGRNLITLGIAPTAALALITKSAIDFESSFAGVRKTVDASDEEFKQLTQNFRDISKTVPTSVNELNRIAEIAGQLGISGVEDITQFTETIAKIADTTNLTSEEAATSFARIINIMGEGTDVVDNMASTVVDLGNNFATTEGEIITFANRIAGAGRISGLMTEDVLAIGAAMSSVGVQAEAGGTAVQKVLISMARAVNEGNEDLEIFAKTAGLTVDEFTNIAPIEQFINFVGGLGDAGLDATQILAELGLDDQRLVRSFLSLASANDLLVNSVDRGETAWMENTALTEEAAKRYETVASQIAIFKNNLIDVALTLGAIILPALITVLEALKPLIEKFAEFAEKNPELIVILLTLGAALGAIGVAMVALGIFISALGGAIGALITIVGAVLPVIGAVIAILGGPLTLIILAVMALVALFTIAWKNNWLGIRDKTKAVVDWFKNTALPTIESFLNLVMAAVNSFVAGWVERFNKIRDAVNSVIDAISRLISKAREIGSNIGGALGFQHGGTVPGGFGEATPAILHGGERVIPRTGTDVNQPDSGGGGVTINLTVEGDVNSIETLETIIDGVRSALGRDNELAIQGVAI